MREPLVWAILQLWNNIDYYCYESVTIETLLLKQICTVKVDWQSSWYYYQLRIIIIFICEISWENTVKSLQLNFKFR